MTKFSIKNKSKHNSTNKSGFTLIEALTVLFIFSLITLTFYSIFSLGGRYIIESKNRLGAVALANEKIEIIRNLQYDDIGIAGGIPSGDIAASEEAISGNQTYHVRTLIQYVDDALDGVAPDDATPNDYKRVKVSVSWQGVKSTQSEVSLVSRFVPAGVEQAAAGGMLAINVIGSNGIGVPQSSVHITNSTVSPAVNMTSMTDNSGNLMLPGAKQSIQGYYMTVTKNGYETVETIDPESVTYSVTDSPASVVEGMLNIKSIVQDKLVDLKIFAVDYADAALPDVELRVEGGRILGYDMMYSPAKPIYNLISNETTNASGEVDLGNVSPGQFFISNIVAPADYTLIGLVEFLSFDALNNKYAILTEPGSEREVKIRFAKNADNAVLVKILNDADNSPVAGAVATLTNVAGHNETQTTLADGVAFFPLAGTPLELGTYELRVTSDNFDDYTGTFEVDQLITQEIKLTAN